MPFDFYHQLSRKQQRDYRKSDKIEDLPFPRKARQQIWARVDALEAALAAGKQKRLQATTAELCLAVTQAFGVDPVRVQVKSRRPVDRDGSEYYGLTTWEDGKPPLIELWMRTRAQKRVVAFKTYMRTLIHELLHHLDYSYLGLEETFHTQGFFKRESSLFRQLVTDRPSPPNNEERETPASPRSQGMQPKPRTDPPRSSDRRRKRETGKQLTLAF